MSRPGDRLRLFARRVCSAETLERLIDPLIADLQFEHANHVRVGRTWRARWHLLGGYAAFWKVLGICALTASVGAIRDWAEADERAMVRTMKFSAAIVGLFTLLLMVPPFIGLKVWRFQHLQPWLTKWSSVRALLYVVPQALPLAVVFGLPIGILCGLRGRRISRRIAGSVICFALVCGAVSFVSSAWILPKTNQAFRVLVSGRPSPLKGPNEMTIGELRARVAQWNANERPLGGLSYAQSYYVRWAASFAPIVLGCFAVSLAATWRRTSIAVLVCVVASTVYLAYGALVVLGLPSGSQAWLPSWAAIWLPNIIFGALSLVLLVHSKAWANWRTPQSS